MEELKNLGMKQERIKGSWEQQMQHNVRETKCRVPTFSGALCCYFGEVLHWLAAVLPRPNPPVGRIFAYSAVRTLSQHDLSSITLEQKCILLESPAGTLQLT